jgi:ABC-type transport system involved in multi-copper enzyme maturation permease subunit
VSLYKAETRRLVKRRFTKFFTAGALLVLVAVAIGMFFTNEKVGADQIAKAQAQAQADYERAVAQTATDRQTCEAAKGTPTASQWPANCDELYQPQQGDFNADWYMPSTFDFRESFPSMVVTLAALLALAAYVVGASFVGAEWNSGGMMNLLLWRPQRLKVLGTKLAAFLVGAAGLTVVVTAIWTAIFYLIAGARGSTESMTSGAWQSIGLMELRALILVLVAGALGFGLASLGRHTAMALGAAIGLIVVFQFGLGVVLDLASVKFAEAYLIPVWLIAWLSKEYKVEDYNSCDFNSVSGCVPDSLTITWPMAGGVLAVVFVAVVGAAMWTMRSRDIT